MKSSTAVLVVIVVIVATIGVYAAWTYPRDVVKIPISFTEGVDSTTQSFTVPALDNQVQVVINIQSGATIWRATILSGNSTVWTHTAVQGELTTFSSGWIALQPGEYNFTFGTLGISGVNGQVTVMAKGIFW